jgi:homoserine kinase
VTRPSPVAVRVPATSANLGPGFDSFGLALALYDTVEVSATSRGLSVEVVGQGAADVPRDERNLVVRALRATLDVLETPQPGLRLTCRNSVPHGRGLGSSAAAIVAGIRLAEALAPDSALPPVRTLEIAAALEGHPDNVAACLLGGLTVAWTEPAPGPGQEPEQERARAVRLDVHPDVRPAVLVPPTSLSTQAARELLPDKVSHRDASRNAAHAGLLVAALTAYPEHLLAATEDRLHQKYRRPAMPETVRLLDSLRGDGIAAVVSGAGPAVLALGTRQFGLKPARWTPAGWRALVLAVDPAGAVGIRLGNPALEGVHDSSLR